MSLGRQVERGGGEPAPGPAGPEPPDEEPGADGGLAPPVPGPALGERGAAVGAPVRTTPEVRLDGRPAAGAGAAGAAAAGALAATGETVGAGAGAIGAVGFAVGVAGAADAGAATAP
ncbi:MAG: hypothetical protein RL461_1073, partial [Planctomycetota bacterium]